MDFSTVLHADQIEFYTDRALNEQQLGVGGHFRTHWFAGRLTTQDGLSLENDLNIQIVEL